MSFLVNEVWNTETFRTASACAAFSPVVLSASQALYVLPANTAASAGQLPAYGLTMASQPTLGYNVAVQTGGIGKAVAAASIGMGGRVGVGIATTGLVPVGASGVAAASGFIKYQVGIAMEAAAAGSIFSVKIQPQQVV